MNCIPREQFVPREYLNQLTCSIGLGVYNNPVALPCQHVFCKACIESWLAKNGTCPKCRESFRKEALKPQWIFAKIIKSALVTCSNSNCKWTGPYDALEEHLSSECLETVCFCSFGCGIQNKRSEIIEHEKTCELRIIDCKFCKVRGSQKAISAHEADCCKNLVSCPNGCGKILSSSAMKHHMKEDCEKGEMKCRFAKTAGCKFIGNKEQLAEHYIKSRAEHLLLLGNSVNMLQEAIEKIEKARKETILLAAAPPRVDSGGGIVWTNGTKFVSGALKSGWSVFLSKTNISGNFRARIRIAQVNEADMNGWKICIGVFNSTQFVPGSWGKYKNGWGYIMGNGYKVYTESSYYGAPYGNGDIITIQYLNRALTFYKNNDCQGPAFNDINGPLYLAVALSDSGHNVEIMDVISI